LKKVKMNARPTLTIQGKRSFLEYALELANEKAPKSFLNSLVISKEFLNVSKYYPFYSLDARDESGDFDDCCLRFMNLALFKPEYYQLFEYPYVATTCFHLSCETTCSVISLLKPGYFSLTLISSEYYDDVFKNCVDLIGRVSGKLCLFTSNLSEDEFALLVNQVSNKISCTTMLEFLLTNEKLAPLPKLDTCAVEETINADQLDGILRHKINTLIINVSDEFYDEESPASVRERLKLKKCGSLQHLFVKMPQLNDTVFLPLFDQFIQCCPNLRKVHLHIPFEFEEKGLHFHVLDTDMVARELLENHSAAKKLMNDCKKLKDIELVFSSGLTFRYDDVEYDCEWIESLMQNGNFEDLKHEDDFNSTGKLKRCMIDYKSGDHSFKFRQEVHIVYANPDFVDDSDDDSHSHGSH